MFKVTEMWAFLAVGPKDGDEGIPAFLASDGVMMPLVCADKARIESLRPIAQEIATATKVPIVLARFSVRENVEEIKP